MFVDEVTMEVEAGRGGDGCMAFLREKFVPMGGPNGGNGGKGADIIFMADTGLKTLLDLRYQKKIKGETGACIKKCRGDFKYEYKTICYGKCPGGTR